MSVERGMTAARGFCVLALALGIAVVGLWIELDRATSGPTPPRPARLVLAPARFSDLPGWRDDALDGFGAALDRTCRALAAREPISAEPIAGSAADWSSVCALRLAPPPASALDGEALRAALERELRPWAVADGDRRHQALVTGYYEPLLHGSLTPDARYSIPLYLRPPELVDVVLGDFRDELDGRRLAGVVRGDRLVPFADRAELDSGVLAGRGLELVWVDDAVDAFFLHIQGSGRVALPDGTHLRVGYAAQNGRPYVAIGRELVARGAMAIEDVTMQSIRGWLAAHPEQAAEVMRANPSFVFFRRLDGAGPVGSSGVVLEPWRSIAVDSSFVPLGVPIWLDGRAPSPRAGEPDRPLRRLVMAQDTGGAIRGPLRADLFCGHGEEAAEVAGKLKHPARMWILLPRAIDPRTSPAAAGTTPPESARSGAAEGR